MEAPPQKSTKGMKLTPSSSSSSSSSCFIKNLPSPILMEILCRLPIKTLIASKSVCKSWLNLSRDPNFTELHQAKAPIEVCFQLPSEDEDTIKLHMGNFHCLNNFDPRDVKINALFEIPKFSLRLNNTLNYGAGTSYLNFSNSCNGLLCFYGGIRNRFVMVWNPCTSEFITIPTLAATFYCLYGLGFSGKANKYKLLRVSQKPKENVVAKILSIEKGCSWNTLGPWPSYVGDATNFYSTTFLHGTLHWPDTSRTHISTFDFEDEQFRRVLLPPSVGKKRTSEICLVGELSGCLFITESTGEGFNIWLMKEYGVQDSWTKMYYMPHIGMGELLNQNCFRPVTCMDNGEILLVAHGKLLHTRVFSYNPDKKSYRLIGSGHGFLMEIPYRPGLVPLIKSMLGYKVHVSALKCREMSTSPDWWTPIIDGGKRKGHVSATSTSLALGSSVAMATLQHVTEGGESHGHIGGNGMIQISKPVLLAQETPAAELAHPQGSVLPNVSGMKELCAQKQEFEERLRNEVVKAVEPFKEQIELLKKHTRQLEEGLQDEKGKVKQQIQQIEQLKQQIQRLEERLKNKHTT